MKNQARTYSSWLKLPLRLSLACLALVESNGCTTHKGPNKEMASRQPPRSSSSSEAQELERQLLAAPNDLELRSRLLQRYFLDWSPEGRAARSRHALWVIENAPASELAGNPETQFDEILDPDGYSRARDIWKINLKTHESDARVMSNAAHFFIFGDHPYAEKLCQQSIELEPTNPKWRLQLASLYMLEARRPMSLADALLKRGERDTVVEYLQQCSRFWKGRSEALNGWMAQIRSGQTPQLNRFLARRGGS
jgi:hypothetical protein